MRKYNYFDDEPEYTEKRGNIFSELDFGTILTSTKDRLDDFIHGDTIRDLKEIRTMPELQKVMLKLTAFALFVVSIIIFIIGFSHTIHTQNKKFQQYYNDAGKVCTDYITEYGTVKWERLDKKTYGKDTAKMTGLCYARQMDFNNDSDDELMLCYNDKNTYVLEVWGYDGKEFKKLYSESANTSKNKKDGAWISLYHKNNKYYIGKSQPDSPEAVVLYTLRGHKFVESSKCDYDCKNNIYSVKGKINAQDFETIKLSAIKTAKAEGIVDTVTKNIDSFATVSLATLEARKTPEQLKADAYFEVIESRIQKYGEGKIVKNGGKQYIEGLAVVKLVDFNKDGNEELLLVYRKMLKISATNAYNGENIIIEEPTYCMEVYGWNGTIAQKLFSKDSISEYLEDNNTNYIILQDTSKAVNICANTYSHQSSYYYTASSRIYGLKGKEFVTKFNAKVINDYGYRDYYINNEYTYSSTFEEKGYKVPKFLNDGGKYNDEVYTLIYVSGANSNTFSKTLDDSLSVIQTLNKSYSPK